MKTVNIVAAGGAVTRQTREGIEILLVHRHRYRDWSLPKGKTEPGETLVQTAVREVREETGQDVVIEEYLGEVHYTVNGVPKIVHYWRMTPFGEPGPVTDQKEVAETAWVAATEVLTRLSYPVEREFLSRTLLGRG